MQHMGRAPTVRDAKRRQVTLPGAVVHVALHARSLGASRPRALAGAAGAPVRTWSCEFDVAYVSHCAPQPVM